MRITATATMLAKLRALAKLIWADTTGVILPYVTIMLVVIVGVSVLAVDGARVMSLQTQLQNGADALALAGAAELDGVESSITRATNAINNLVANKTLPGMGNQNVQVSTVRFVSQLPANDADPITAVLCTIPPSGPACTTEHAKVAQFVEVTVQPVALPNILPASLFFSAAPNATTTGAQAVAGRGNEVVCGIPPVFICNPYETAGMTDGQATAALNNAAADPTTRRRQLKLNASKTGAGQFGWLVPPDGATGASDLANWIGAVSPAACYKKASVDLNTGEKQSANAGFNVRFDLYEGGNPLNRPSTAYAPALNVRKGYTWHNPNWCAAAPASNPDYYSDPAAGALPRDTSFSNDVIGNGVWNCEAYWSKEHPNYSSLKPAGCSNPATISRYDIYRYETNYRDAGVPVLINDWSGNGQPRLQNSDPGNGESGKPLCAAGAGVNGVDVTTGATDRRLIFVAVINCGAQGPFPSGSNATNIPVAGFGKLFMTQPIYADGDSTRPLYTEFAGLATLADGVRNLVPVQLYR